MRVVFDRKNKTSIDLNIDGIKAVKYETYETGFNINLVLKSNGNLYNVYKENNNTILTFESKSQFYFEKQNCNNNNNNNLKKTLLASNVIDIDSSTYITSNKWFYLDNDLKSHLIMESSEDFLSVGYYCNFLLI